MDISKQSNPVGLYKKQSKAEGIYQYIHDNILEGRWEPGDRLNDQELATEIQASRISVREALFKLLETGIIEKIHWKGYFLKSIDAELVNDLADIRIALESVAIRNMADNPKPDSFRRMTEAIDTSEVYLEQNDLANYLKSETQFHEILCNDQQNSYITSILNKYQILIHFIRITFMKADGDLMNTAKRSITEHREILNYIKQKDVENATRILNVHVLRNEKDVVT